MSVTFAVQSNETYYPPCPDCRGTLSHDPEPDHGCSHPDCLGYGPDPIRSTPMLNVSNVNARSLLGVLDYHGDLAGELDAGDLGIRVAIVRAMLDSVPARFAHFGLSSEQISRYCEALSEISEVAARRREPIFFG